MKTLIISGCFRVFLQCLALFALLLPEYGAGHDWWLASAPADVAVKPDRVRLQLLLDTAVREGLPGVSLSVRGPGIDFQGAAGVANWSTGEVLTTNHALYTASLGKTFTATLALQLCEQGHLDLNTPITTWVAPDKAERISSSGRITLQHLLSHTSGLLDYMNDLKDWRSDFARNPHRRWTHDDVIPYIYDRPVLFEPGTDYHYSNSNYILIGHIIEQVMQQPLHALIRQRILIPVGMCYTYNGQEHVSDRDRAHGYIRRRARIIDTFPWYSHYGLADSGLFTTPGDLTLFIESLFKSEKLISESMRTRMTTATSAGYPPSDYGMGIYIQQNPWGAGHIWYTHDGIDPGYQADMMYLPERDLIIVLSANASLGKANIRYERLIRAVVEAALQAV